MVSPRPVGYSRIVSGSLSQNLSERERGGVGEMAGERDPNGRTEGGRCDKACIQGVHIRRIRRTYKACIQGVHIRRITLRTVCHSLDGRPAKFLNQTHVGDAYTLCKPKP